MQKRKFDELISHFNRKVSDMSIDQKYKMELLGMISAIGFAHEKELSTNSASLGTDLISRKQAIDALENDKAALSQIISGMSANDAQLDHYLAQRNQVVYDIDAIKQLPPIQPEPQYKTDYGFMWICPKCGLPVHSDYTKCVRCGHNREKGV